VRFHADLHIHSKYSRACSKDCDLPHLTWWARRKGVTVLGTGDFTHPAWFDHLRENLRPAEPGLFRLRDDADRDITRTLPPSLAARQVRFMLSVEISTIYKRDERTRKIHHLVYMPDLTAAAEFNRRLGRIGNLGSDGRPILGLDSRDLLDITLECSDGAYLVPAHVWTPWFAALGSKSGFDAIDDCYADLAGHIFALETGLSSDPAMNWRVSGLDRYRLMSSSDAHSPPIVGRETTVFSTDLDYFALRGALQTGAGHAGSVEFFPEEGKYHADGHRACGVRLEPQETRSHGGMCPECGKPLTVGVLSRVCELADRPEPARPAGAADFRHLVPLPEVMSEILGTGPKSKRVLGEIDRLTTAFGSELTILEDVPVDDIATRSPLLAEAVARLRRGDVIREAGYDGEYGVIRLFTPGELERLRAATSPALFGEPAVRAVEPSGAGPSGSGRSGAVARTAGAAVEPAGAGLHRVAPREHEAPRPAPPHTAGSLFDELDAEQRAAAELGAGPLLIIAGPGTGKTRTLVHRLAYLVTARGVPPERCLAITFTRRAAEEMEERLGALLPEQAVRLTIGTFHALGARILRQQHERAGLSPHFGIADQARRLAVAAEVTASEREARRLLARRSRRGAAAEGELEQVEERYLKALRRHDLVDFEDLIDLPVGLLESDPDLAAAYREQYPWIFVDEYQDIDEPQYRLLRQLAPAGGNLTAIGDPDQAIYGFRGADVGLFLRFQQDFPDARTVQLTRNYRSGATILEAARQLMAPATLVPHRVLRSSGAHGLARVGLQHAPSEPAEAAFVARTIEQLLGGASFHSLDSGRVEHGTVSEMGFSDFAVLYRTDHQARAVMDALAQAGLPFQKRSHDRLIDRPGVAAILAELSGRAAAAGRAADAAAPVLPRLHGAAGALVDRVGASHPPETAGEIRSAVDLLEPLAGRCGNDLEGFCRELALGVEVDTWDPRADRISLLTLHAAKGLEFPVVFVVGCEDGLLPFRWPTTMTAGSGGNDRPETNVAEERRLLFVGMTRAQRKLYLSHAAERMRHGRVRRAQRSPFLADLDPSVCEQLGDAQPRRRPRETQLRLL
jgi:DNA helicase II / ATP-dependent DNA helicase PcrA